MKKKTTRPISYAEMTLLMKVNRLMVKKGIRGDAMNEIIIDVLRENINKRVLIFLKNEFRFEGILLQVDDYAVKLNDRKVGVTAISISDIMNVRGVGGKF